MELAKKYKTLLNNYGVSSPLRLAHFFAQIHHESGLKPIAESFNYSPERLLKVFPRYFKTVDEARKYAGKQQMTANYVYQNRMGNGPSSTGDGWKFRGRGFMQTTGRSNYTALSKYTKVDYISNPDLLLTEADAMIAALYYWKTNNLNRYADRDDIDAVSDAINIGRQTAIYGDANGFKDRLDKLNMYKEKFGV